ncbi:MAG: tRNA pseudouridine(55) synthase TruB [Acidobacteriota bacterium]|nr:tRNA pseudouridine(55) synthase TruB [Acidobacteriota bacterium]
MNSIDVSINGIAIIDKPVGWTSHDVVARARRLLNERRIGHTGTLDPFATGVLVLLIGRATRLAPFFAQAEKEYEAVVRLGYATETGDLTGTPRPASHAFVDCAAWSDVEIEAVIKSLRGEHAQVPPMYSAKKVKGQKLYELARQGKVIERAPVPVTIHEFETVRQADGALLRRDDEAACDLSVRVVCSAGTYVRVLAETLGERLGVGAHLAALRRTRAGAFHIANAIDVEMLGEVRGDSDRIKGIILSPAAALHELPSVHLTGDAVRRVRHGAMIRVDESQPPWADATLIRMHDEQGELIAVGMYEATSGQLRPRMMLAPA